MSDWALEALIKGRVSTDVIKQYVLTKCHGMSAPPTLRSEINVLKAPRPKNKCTEKHLAALAAGRANNHNIIAKQKQLGETKLDVGQKTKEASAAPPREVRQEEKQDEA